LVLLAFIWRSFAFRLHPRRLAANPAGRAFG
jgi:hypothetical protein